MRNLRRFIKKQNKNCVKTIIRTGTSKAFFDRGLKIAKSLDKKEKKFRGRRVISFEDPRDLLEFIEKKNLLY